MSQALGVDSQGPAGLGARPALYTSMKETWSLSPPRDDLVPEYPIRGHLHLKAGTCSLKAVAAELRDRTSVRAMGALQCLGLGNTFFVGTCACRAQAWVLLSGLHSDVHLILFTPGSLTCYPGWRVSL